MRQIAVEVGRAFPDAHRREMGRLQGRDLPLVHGVVRNAVDADLAVGPGRHAGPFDAVVEILRLARRPKIHEARRAAGTAGIDADHRVAVGHPFLGVDDLPVLVLVGRAGDHVGVLLGHAPPLIGVEILEVQQLAVRSVGDDHGIAAVLDGPIDIGAQHDAVVHGDRHVPIDRHPIADFALELAHSPSRISRRLATWT